MLWAIFYLFFVFLTLYRVPFLEENESAKLVFFLSLLGLSLAEIIHILSNRVDTVATYTYLIHCFFNSIFFYAGLTLRKRKKFYLWSIYLSVFNFIIGSICFYIGSR